MAAAGVEKDGRLSEKEICELLDQIHERTGKDNSLVFNYRFKTLLTLEECQANFTIKDGYMRLREHRNYFDKALSLVIYMMEGHGSKDEITKLMAHVKSTRIFETDIVHQRLNLWRMLTNLATELSSDEDDVQNLVIAVGENIRMNTDHIKVHDKFSLASALNAFQRLEEKKRFEPLLEGQKEHCLCTILLERLFRKKLYENYVQQFNPVQPLSLAVLDIQQVEGAIGVHATQLRQTVIEHVQYKESVTSSYQNMCIIEFNQWPPVTEYFYINLAIITSDFMPRDDTYSRATIRGSVDDLYKKKESTTFEEVFPENLGSKKKRHVVLIEGRPGCGKSTLITKVSKDWAEGKLLQDIELFLLIRLRRFADRDSLTLKDLLGIYCPNAAVVNAVHDKITREGGKGVCFAFDGLDEYSAKLKPRNLITKLINGLHLPNAAIIMTTRPATGERFRRKLLLSQNIEIIGFLEEEIKAYIDTHYKNKEGGGGKAYKLKKYIADHPNISQMCYLPLHIAMIVFLYDISPLLLPETETDLYYKFTLHTLYRSLLKDEDSDQDDHELERFGMLPDPKKEIFQKVCKLAFEATAQQKQMFTGTEIQQRVGLPEIPLKREIDSLGLLTVDRMISLSSGLPTKTFSFLHLTHQEFLAAVHIVDHLTDDEELEIAKSHADKVHMWVVWKFLCGIHTKNSKTPNNRSDIFTKTFQCIITHNVSSDSNDVSKRLACLNMIHCAFESRCQASCQDLVAHIKGVVNVVDIALNPSDCSALGYVFARAHNKVKKIDFSYCHLGPDGIAAFVRQLKEFSGELTEVHMLRLRARTDYKPLGSKGVTNLVKLLEKLPNLGELRLYGNKLKTETFSYLLSPISNLKQLHTLILSRNDLEVDTGPLLSDMLGNLPLLHTFYASYNPLTDQGLQSMKPGLLKCEKLKILGLRGTSLGQGAGVHLSEILSTLTKLEWLELYQNKLDDKAVCDMLPGLQVAKTLQTFSLVNNCVSDCGGIALANYIRTTSTLKEMRIYYNYEMSDVGKRALRVAVLERPKHLNYLGLAV